MNRTAIDGWRKTNNERLFGRKIFACLGQAMFLLLVSCCLLLNVYAQTDESIDESAPPPLKILSKSEKSQLLAVTDLNKRTKLAIELIEVRLVNAENYNLKEEYREMFNELGIFHAIVDNTLEFLKVNNNDGRKVLNNFKRIELNLRKYITRLELIRRELPTKYEPYVRQLTKYIRDARTDAVEPLFEDSVIPLDKPE